MGITVCLFDQTITYKLVCCQISQTHFHTSRLYFGNMVSFEYFILKTGSLQIKKKKKISKRKNLMSQESVKPSLIKGEISFHTCIANCNLKVIIASRSPSYLRRNWAQFPLVVSWPALAVIIIFESNLSRENELQQQRNVIRVSLARMKIVGTRQTLGPRRD